MGVLLISATNSSESINRKIMDMVLSENFFDCIDLVDYSEIPILSKDIQIRDGIPSDIIRLLEVFRNKSKLVFFVPEHNGYVSAYFKNIIDWLSRAKRDFLSDKKVILISVSETVKEIRAMEDPITKTFSLFSPDSFLFLNFNKYGLDLSHDIDRAKKLVDLIKEL